MNKHLIAGPVHTDLIEELPGLVRRPLLGDRLGRFGGFGLVVLGPVGRDGESGEK